VASGRQRPTSASTLEVARGEAEAVASEETGPGGQSVEHLGARLRAQRAARGLTIAQLASAAGLTKGFVSRLERDQSSVSIAALLRICDVLHTPIGRLFEAPSTALVRASDAPVVEFGKGMRRLIYTPADVGDLQVIKMQLDPGASAGREAYAIRGGSQFVQVLIGSLEFQLEAEHFRLAEGDSLTFQGTRLHTYRNASRRAPCEALMVLTPAT
jgi:transcriptional regulator with XRE-family HTH domain